MSEKDFVKGLFFGKGNFKGIPVHWNSSGCSPMLRWGGYRFNDAPNRIVFIGKIGGVLFYTNPDSLQWDNELQKSSPYMGVVLDGGRDARSQMWNHFGPHPRFRPPLHPKFSDFSQNEMEEFERIFTYVTYGYCHPDYYAQVNKDDLAEAIRLAMREGERE